MTTPTCGFEAAGEIERLRSENDRLKEWCRKLIEGGTFPGEADNLRSLNAELVAALENIKAEYINGKDDADTAGYMSVIAAKTLAKVKERK